MTELAAERVVICRVAGTRFALPVSVVREVVAAVPVTRIPGAPAEVLGIANVHGSLVTSVSAARLLGLATEGGEECLLVLSMEAGRVGIAVEEVEDVEASRGEVQQLDLEALLRPLLAPTTS
jgi:purine-binding chemotaxis protein CheW